MKKTILLSLCFCAMSLLGHAQSARHQIESNNNLAASNYLAYPGPTGSLTPAPKGYEPYYISHYGRHGSRYLVRSQSYDEPYNVLMHADSLGMLTPLGCEVLEMVKEIRDEAQQRWGELTLRGAEQHQQIAHRMYKRFPQVFAGSAPIDAKSTVVIRCILSMENALQELTRLNPRLKIRHDASYHDMYYMNDEKSKYLELRKTPEAKQALDEFDKRHGDRSHLMSELFKDPAYAKTINATRFGNDLLTLAANLQSTELRHKFSLWKLFTADEIYNYWLQNNAFWYSYFGPNKLNNKAGIYSQVNLLRNIISTADTCLLKKHPGATLRFAHESDVMPLVCLLNLNHYGESVDSLEELDSKGWHNFNIYPMGCNVQFIFYKPKKAKPNLDDVLVKVLLNENEATLPIKTDRAPYYHWKDVRNYYLNQISGK